MKYGNRAPAAPRWKKIVGSPVGLLVLVVILVFIAKAAWSIRQKSLDSETKLSEARAELAKVQARDADLSRQVAYLSTDQGVEAELRSKYHAVNDGESVAVVLDDPQADTADADAPIASSTAPTGWWQGVLRFIGL